MSFVFQGCEHINRAITIERADFNSLSMEEVNVVPDVHAGGSLSTYAYQHMDDPMVVEHISVPKGIDIGQTLIGMHIKHVFVPLTSTNCSTFGSVTTYCDPVTEADAVTCAEGFQIVAFKTPSTMQAMASKPKIGVTMPRIILACRVGPALDCGFSCSSCNKVIAFTILHCLSAKA